MLEFVLLIYFKVNLYYAICIAIGSKCCKNYIIKLPGCRIKLFRIKIVVCIQVITLTKDSIQSTRGGIGSYRNHQIHRVLLQTMGIKVTCFIPNTEVVTLGVSNSEVSKQRIQSSVSKMLNKQEKTSTDDGLRFSYSRKLNFNC